MTRYLALLRGINVGGHKRIKMDELRKAFEALGFQNVKTVLATGNVLFEASNTDLNALVKTIEEKLNTTFHHKVPVILRTIQDIQNLVDSDPFKQTAVTPDTRLYVTFLSEIPKSKLKVPYESPDKGFRILRVSDGVVCSVLTLTPSNRTVDSMKIIEKEFGKNITTRNWNTVSKFLQAKI